MKIFREIARDAGADARMLAHANMQLRPKDATERPLGAGSRAEASTKWSSSIGDASHERSRAGSSCVRRMQRSEPSASGRQTPRSTGEGRKMLVSHALSSMIHPDLPQVSPRHQPLARFGSPVLLGGFCFAPKSAHQPPVKQSKSAQQPRY